ncbi:MAG: nitrous oxide reductase accessory protein NosL [Rhodothalassiaceae bacterium]
MRRLTSLPGLLGLLLLAACGGPGEQQAPPPPAPLTRDAVGYFCGMIVVDHEGPKAQIHLRGQEEPLFFTSVRDAVAFTRLPDAPHDIVAFYVHDMARAQSWEHPGDEAWMEAEKAFYVIGSDRRGGMGAPEAVPFSSREAAERFVAQHGGRIVRLDGIPRDYVLGTDADEQGDAP